MAAKPTPVRRRLHVPAGRQRADHRAGRGARRRGGAGGRGRRRPAAEGAAGRGRAWASRCRRTTARRCSCRSRCPATRTPRASACSRCCDATAAVQAAHPDAAGRAGRRPVDQQGARRDARRGLPAGRDAQPAGHAGDPDRRVRRADRGRRAGAAGPLVGGRGDRPVHARLAPGPGDRHHQQRDPADRHGGRRRLLAVLRPPGTRGTGQGAHRTSTRWRSPRRPPATPSWSPASR